MIDDQPYIINPIYRDNLDTGTMDILNYFTKEGFYNYLDRISAVFNSLSSDAYLIGESTKLYFIAQTDYKAIKVGLANNPFKRIRSLQTGNPYKLKILYFYDPILYEKEHHYPLKHMNAPETIHEHEAHQLRWLSPPRDISSEFFNGEWFLPNDRSFRVLIRHALFVLDWYEKKIKGEWKL